MGIVNLMFHIWCYLLLFSSNVCNPLDIQIACVTETLVYTYYWIIKPNIYYSSVYMVYDDSRKNNIFNGCE